MENDRKHKKAKRQIRKHQKTNDNFGKPMTTMENQRTQQGKQWKTIEKQKTLFEQQKQATKIKEHRTL